MARLFIGVGSNIAPEVNIPRALALLQAAVRITAVSTFYRTPALGGGGQSPFANGVFAATSALPPQAMKFTVLRGVEAALGRRRGPDRYAPREIDLDLLWYDALALQESDLCLPDPEIARRAFLAVPLCELAPELELDGVGLPALAAALAGDPLEPLPGLTHRLRALLTA